MAAKDKIKTITPEFRLAFPSLFTKAKAFTEGGVEKFEITMLFDKRVDLKALKALCEEAAKARWGQIPKGLKMPFRDGNEKEANGFNGTNYAHAKSLFAVSCINSDKSEIIEADDLYAGCYCKASIIVDTYEQVNEKKQVLGKGIKFLLRAVMKTREGEPLVVRVNAAEDFADEASNDPSNYNDNADDGLDFLND